MESIPVVMPYSDEEVEIRPISAEYFKTFGGATCVLLKLQHTWRKSSNLTSRVLIKVPKPTEGKNIYDLVRKERIIGLSPRGASSEVFWVETFEETLEGLVFHYTNEDTGVGAVALIKLGYVSEEERVTGVAEWLVGTEYIKLYGNLHALAPNGLEGRRAIRALIEGLRLVLGKL
jgi:hypothetical protein